MATPETTKRFIIKIGDGANPEIFAFPCGANARSVNLTNNLGEDVLLDCDNPTDLPAVITRYLESQDTTLNIEGRIAKESFAMWRQWADSGTERNVRIELDEPAASGGGFWVLPCYLGSFDIGAEGSASATVSASIMGNGRRAWTDAAA